MTLITTTPPSGVNKGRADFVKTKFDALIYEKGYDVVHEKSLKCSCVSKTTNQQSSCKNCGGTSWIFINPVKTRMVIHSMNLNTKFKEWSQENIGTASISALAETEVSFMDRITVLDGVTIFNEVCFLKKFDTLYYFTTVYDIKEIVFIGLFRNTDQILTPLKYKTDFIYSDHKITFLTASMFTDINAENLDVSISIRYKHSPQLHIIDAPRDTIQSFVNIAGEGEQEISLPVHCIGRRSHYVLDRQNVDGTRVLDNSNKLDYDYFNPPKQIC